LKIGFYRNENYKFSRGLMGINSLYENLNKKVNESPVANGSFATWAQLCFLGTKQHCGYLLV
jgi:hypothetical protein